MWSQGCVVVDQRCRGSKGKVKIEGYMRVSDEEAHQHMVGLRDVCVESREKHRNNSDLPDMLNCTGVGSMLVFFCIHVRRHGGDNNDHRIQINLYTNTHLNSQSEPQSTMD